jgi:UDP-glucose 4-epimerase
MTNIIIGSGNLSLKLQQKLGGIIVSIDFIDDFFSKNIEENVNIIFNQFQKSTKLYDVSAPNNYINRSILSTAKVLNYIKSKNLKVNKIIYTSSSSVYGDNPSCQESDNPKPKSLHSALKLSNEKLIELFCKENSIDYTITRIFNMYGGDDSFSIISKIINSYKEKKCLTLVNHGESIRDYIYIDDVVYSYEKILSKKDISMVNIGTSMGKSVLFILNFLQLRGINIEIENIYRDELKISISKNEKLLEILNDHHFKKVEDFIYKELV